jgi:hypothetical protein
MIGVWPVIGSQLGFTSLPESLELARETDSHYRSYMETKELPLLQASDHDAELKTVLLAMLDPKPMKRLKLTGLESIPFFKGIKVCTDTCSDPQWITHSHEILDTSSHVH